MATVCTRFVYRRLHILLKREGWEVNWKKLYRLYREEGLTVRKRGGCRSVIGTRKTLVFVTLICIMAAITGKIFGTFWG